VPAALDALLEAIDGADRLVLLGDVVEMTESSPVRAMAAAEDTLRAIGRRVGADREVIVVPGNHDRPLVRPWSRDIGSALAVDTLVPLDVTSWLAQLTAFLAPARVRAHYPGVWLGDGVYATHGHYLDRHLLPETAYGVARGLLGRLPHDGATPAQYESAGGPSVTRVEGTLSRLLPTPLARGLEAALVSLRARTMPRLVRPSTAPMMRRLLGAQMRRAAIPALARVAHRLDVDAEWVIFGHVHRLGPLADDDPAQWAGPEGRPRIANTGSWVYEGRLLHRAQPPHPYWPGGAIVVEDGTPRAIGLLDHLGGELLDPRRRG
jgi:UDP-2,3-diacylglucosamine pyrophosphatase LpxH